MLVISNNILVSKLLAIISGKI